MRLRWLIGNFADPQYDLKPKLQHELSNLAHARYMPARRLVTWTLVGILLPLGLLYKLAMPLVLEHYGWAGRTGPVLVAVMALVFLSWPLSAWVYGHLYTTATRRAMRDRGFDVCVACGYLLEPLPAAVRQCPECGQRREPLPEAKDEGVPEV